MLIKFVCHSCEYDFLDVELCSIWMGDDKSLPKYCVIDKRRCDWQMTKQYRKMKWEKEQDGRSVI